MVKLLKHKGNGWQAGLIIFRQSASEWVYFEASWWWSWFNDNEESNEGLGVAVQTDSNTRESTSCGNNNFPNFANFGSNPQIIGNKDILKWCCIRTVIIIRNKNGPIQTENWSGCIFQSVFFVSVFLRSVPSLLMHLLQEMSFILWYTDWYEVDID